MSYDASVSTHGRHRSQPQQRVVMAVVLIGLVTSCGSGRMFEGTPPIDHPVPTASGPPPPLTDDPHSQVERLHADLVHRRDALALPTPPPSAEDACEPVCVVDDPPGPPSRAAGCAPEAGSACAGACAQADAACDDAAQICAIAKLLRTEAWASGECLDANATCIAAHAPCCGCKG